MGSFEGMKEKTDAKTKVLIWLLLIYIVILLTVGAFAVPIVARLIAAHKG